MISSVAETIQQLRDMEGYLVDPDLIVRIFEILPVAIVVVDEKGRIQLVNAQAELMFGYHRKELFDQLVEVLLPKNDALRLRHVQHRASFAADPRVRPMGLNMKLSARKKNGDEFPVEIYLGPIPSRQGTLTVAVIWKLR